jgi:RNA polymerase sigma-70 factor (ECF subfamily)
MALRARRGNHDAFGELAHRCQASVFNVCYRLMGELREAEDMTQESFMRAYQRFDHFDVNRPFGPWIRRVAANLFINRLKISRMITVEWNDERDVVMAYRARPNLPEDLQLRAARANLVRAAVLSLPAHYRAVVELRHFQEMSYDEIAEFLKLPLSSVKSHLYRERHLLAEELEAYVRVS